MKKVHTGKFYLHAVHGDENWLENSNLANWCQGREVPASDESCCIGCTTACTRCHSQQCGSSHKNFSSKWCISIEACWTWKWRDAKHSRWWAWWVAQIISLHALQKGLRQEMRSMWKSITIVIMINCLFDIAKLWVGPTIFSLDRLELYQQKPCHILPTYGHRFCGIVNMPDAWIGQCHFS